MNLQDCEDYKVLFDLHQKVRKERDQLRAERDHFKRLLDAHTKIKKCAGCGEMKPLPYRRDDLDGYVCLTCVEKYLDRTLDENNSLKLDYSHSEAENAQLAAKCASLENLHSHALLKIAKLTEKAQRLRESANRMRFFCEMHPGEVLDIPDDVWVPFCKSLEETR